MNDLTIKDIEEVIKKIENEEDERLKQLKLDPRKGVQKLIAQWIREKEKEQAELDSFNNMMLYEKQIWKQGFIKIAGIDEVGRGPLAGPVVAAAVILPKDFYAAGLNDSKKLTEKKREELYKIIQLQAISIGIGIIDAKEIDSINIYQASIKAMLHAISKLHESPDYLLIDAVPLHTPFPSESIIKGDSKSISIAAASVIAKVTRDEIMKQYALDYPGYGFEHNMGYGTKEHLEGLAEHGPTPIHRRSFSPVKDYD